jgi:hypothetical protein
MADTEGNLLDKSSSSGAKDRRRKFNRILRPLTSICESDLANIYELNGELNKEYHPELTNAVNCSVAAVQEYKERLQKTGGNI